MSDFFSKAAGGVENLQKDFLEKHILIIKISIRQRRWV